MINTKKTKNNSWNIGSIVNIGFVKGLKVISIKSIIDDLPDIYELVSPKGQKYEFIPHNGLHKI